MSVKRYSVGVDGIDPNGNLVKYEDYAALEQKLIESERYGRQTDITIDNLEMKLAQMAAELNAVEAIHTEAVFITDDHYEQCPPQVQKMIRALAVLQIPAYQAFLAEVRAQGVTMFSDWLTERIHGWQLEGVTPEDLLNFHQAVTYASGFAAQLREGESK
ncbi:hypothetical protein [Enterobacter ludwigii]|uniref:hypothetical protein n=1 Tax=Enterobacter ludwigii TaxID=299767 RepID=UPI002A7FFC3B|nr:hypothetical protein [Enterobacter ludwigii]